MNKKIIAVIPARYGATRFPGKPIVKIQNKEMILWVLEAVKKAKLVSEVIVATDHKDIFNIVRDNAGTAVMTESSLPSGTDRMWAAIKEKSFDFAVNIQGDEPLLNPAHLDSAIQSLIDDDQCQMSTLAQELEVNSEMNELESMNSVKVILNQNNQAIYFSRFGIPYSRMKYNESPLLALKHIGLYVYRSEFLKKFCTSPVCELEKAESLEQLRALFLGAKIKVVKVKNAGWGVDSPEDLIKIEKLLKVKS